MSVNDIRDLAARVLKGGTAPMALTDLFNAMVEEEPELEYRWTLPGRGLAHLLKGDKAKRFKRVSVVSIALVETVQP